MERQPGLEKERMMLPLIEEALPGHALEEAASRLETFETSGVSLLRSLSRSGR